MYRCISQYRIFLSMNRNAIVLAVTILNSLGLAFFAGYYWQKKPSIVYVNTDQLVNGYKGMIDARKVYMEKTATWKANVDTLLNNIQRQIEAYEKESRVMTSRERELTQELIRTKQKQLSEYQKAVATQAQQEDEKMTGEIITQINSSIERFGREMGYTIVMAATQYGNIAYADKELDVTEQLLERINNEYSGQ